MLFSSKIFFYEFLERLAFLSYIMLDYLFKIMTHSK
ncbi:hypothetical protein a15_91 [Escherichia phage a15]|nr:hypothetical protein a15_91 [Escherichia phage a15]